MQKTTTTKKIQLPVRESRWTIRVIYTAALTPTQLFSHNQSRLCQLVSSWFIVSLRYQGCDSEESKNQQLKLYAALSQQLLSFITHDNFATKNSFILLFMFLVFVKVPCLVLLVSFIFFFYYYYYYYLVKPRLFTYLLNKVC